MALFGSARLRPGDAEYEEGRRMGALIARAGWTLCTGGYDGLMAAASEGAAAEGGHVIGVTVEGWSTRSPNRWVAEERAARGLVGRLDELVGSDAWVAMAGGIGTLSEVALAWNMLQSGELSSRPLILVGPRWRALVPILRRELVIGDRDLALVRLAADPEEAIALLGRPPGAG